MEFLTAEASRDYIYRQLQAFREVIIYMPWCFISLKITVCLYFLIPDVVFLFCQQLKQYFFVLHTKKNVNKKQIKFTISLDVITALLHKKPLRKQATDKERFTWYTSCKKINYAARLHVLPRSYTISIG